MYDLIKLLNDTCSKGHTHIEAVSDDFSLSTWLSTKVTPLLMT